MVILIFLFSLLFGSTHISFKPQYNEILFKHTKQIVMGNNDTLSYSLSAGNKTFMSSSISFKFLAKKDNYTISIGDITKDPRIMLLSGDIFSSTRSLYADNDSINIQLGQSYMTSIALSFPLEKISLNPFILTNLHEKNKYLSGGILIDSQYVSMGISYLTSILRDYAEDEPLYMSNQRPLIRGVSSYAVFKKDLLLISDIYSMNLRVAIISSIPINQRGSMSYIMNVNIQDERHEIEYKSTYYPQFALRWNSSVEKKESYFSSIEYIFHHKWFELSYFSKYELYMKGLFAYQIAPSRITNLLSIKGSFYSFSFRTKVEVNDKNMRKEEKKVSLSYSLYSFHLSSSLTMKEASYSFQHNISFKREYYVVRIGVDHKKRISYTINVDREDLPFHLSFTIDSKKYVQISFTIDQ